MKAFGGHKMRMLMRTILQVGFVDPELFREGKTTGTEKAIVRDGSE